jgi:hypothetical protein
MADAHAEAPPKPLLSQLELGKRQLAVGTEIEHAKTSGAFDGDDNSGVGSGERTHANDQVTTRKHAQIDSSSTPAGNGM